VGLVVEALSTDDTAEDLSIKKTVLPGIKCKSEAPQPNEQETHPFQAVHR
jgi:hypothetical protein